MRNIYANKRCSSPHNNRLSQHKCHSRCAKFANVRKQGNLAVGRLSAIDAAHDTTTSCNDHVHDSACLLLPIFPPITRNAVQPLTQKELETMQATQGMQRPTETSSGIQVRNAISLRGMVIHIQFSKLHVHVEIQNHCCSSQSDQKVAKK